eukprot:m.64430 g.64430  ORF g.64430 m.64430 type:complete len:103 (+) comp8224_c0_seq1:86-394(+)
MNSIRSSALGWGAFTVAVMGGMVAANQWRDSRTQEQIQRGSKNPYVMSFEERIRKAEWEAEQADLVKAGKMDQVHPMYLEMQEAQRRTQAKVGHSKWDSTHS